MSDGAPYSPYYTAYASAHGRTPDEMMAHDEERFPGGCMTGYIAWATARQAEFRREQPGTIPSDATRKEFGTWLTQKH